MSQKPRIKLPQMITWSVWVSIQVAGVAVYHLGNNGTARELLKAWPVTSS
jgi:hypothetical protein